MLALPNSVQVLNYQKKVFKFILQHALSCGAVCYTLRGGSNFESVDEILRVHHSSEPSFNWVCQWLPRVSPIKWKLLRSSFLQCYLFLVSFITCSHNSCATAITQSFVPGYNPPPPPSPAHPHYSPPFTCTKTVLKSERSFSAKSEKHFHLAFTLPPIITAVLTTSSLEQLALFVWSYSY